MEKHAIDFRKRIVNLEHVGGHFMMLGAMFVVHLAKHTKLIRFIKSALVVFAEGITA